MKLYNLQKQWLRWCNRLLSGLLLILGFSACDDNSNGGEVMYGQPYTRFEIKGKVVNVQKEPIPGIQVIVKELSLSPARALDTLKTDASGEVLFKESLTSEGKFRLIAEDIDGVQNGGKFKTDSVDIQATTPTEGSGWYMGESKNEVTITLEKDETLD